MVILRDMKEADIETYVRWFTRDTEWLELDAPWESFETTEAEERSAWIGYFHDTLRRPAEHIRYKFEIEADGAHIGWVSAYTDTGYFDNPERCLAIGIDIPEPGFRGRGYGTQALALFMNYYRSLGHSLLYLQTWSGNAAMIAVAKKLGFQEIARIPDARTVKGKHYDALTFQRTL